MHISLFFYFLSLADKELQGSKDQMHVDVVKSRQTVEEQKSAIDILDSALTNAQSNVVRLEEEVNLLFRLVIQAFTSQKTNL